MAAFTTITSAIDAVQNLTIMNEIALAYSERRQAIEQSAFDNWPEGTDMQAASLYSTIQAWLEANCTSFVDHTQAIAGAASVPMFTRATWRTEAGLNDSGFTRKNESGTSYGNAQGNDYVTVPLLSELQAGLSTLKWTVKSSIEASDQEFRRGISGNYSTCVEARNAALADWTATAWSSFPSEYLYIADALLQVDGTNYSASGQRIKGKGVVSGVPTFLPSEALCYGLAEKYVADSQYSDMDGYGFTENTLGLIDDLGSAQTASRTAVLIGNFDESPILTEPLNCPIVDTIRVGILIKNQQWIFKWNFTNA